MQQIDFLSLSSNPVISLFVFFALSLLPFTVLGLTSFLKFSVVFSILRNALGAGQIPGVAISSLLAAILSMQVMQPVFEQTKNELSLISLVDSSSRFKIPSNEELEFVTLPWRNFLLKHSGSREVFQFRKVTRSSLNSSELSENVSEETPLSDFSWLIPAFILTELKEAFVIGFALFIPFVAIDLLVTNLLVGLGMMMVSPNTIALPLKILLFVSCDGWLRLSSSLLAGY